MNKPLNKIEKLIAELCPDGVEWKTLGEVCEVYTGGEAPANSIKGLIPNDIYKYPIYANGSELYGYTDNYKISKDAVTISSIGANTGTIYFRKAFFTPIIRLKVLLPKYDNLSSKYIYYYLSSIQINSKKSSVPNMNAADVKKIPIPIPPLAIQQEIVKILDTFTTLEAELEAELEARKKQYAYYRDELLTFGEDVEWKAIKDLFDFKNGLNKGKEYFGKGTPIVNFTDVFKNHSLTCSDLKGKVEVTSKEKLLYSAQKNDIFFTRTSETQGEIGMVAALLDDVEDCVFSGFVLRARPKTKLLNSKFCSYFLTSNSARKEIIRNSSFTTRALTSGPRLSKIRIPIPPLTEQNRIVAILDKFDALVNDISVGLPAELNARRKQYEYYRNKLLSFKMISE